jgi:hypothetical protein
MARCKSGLVRLIPKAFSFFLFLRSRQKNEFKIASQVSPGHAREVSLIVEMFITASD